MTTNSNGQSPQDPQMSQEEIQAVIDRILAKDQAASTKGPDLKGRAQAISAQDAEHSEFDGDQQDLEERRALRRVAGLSTELEDVTEVEYRQLRLERGGVARGGGRGTAE